MYRLFQEVKTLSNKNSYQVFKHYLHSALATAWLGLAVGSRMDLRSVRITHVKQVQYVKPQEERILLALLSPSPSNSDVCIHVYIDVN